MNIHAELERGQKRASDKRKWKGVCMNIDHLGHRITIEPVEVA
jgi:hypothetical protein